MKPLNALTHLATLGPVGYIPVASGTFGTAVAVLFLMLTQPSTVILLIFVLIFAVLGTISSHFAEISLNEKDSGKIVIDEFTGFLVTMSFVEINAVTLFLAFIFFRIFDILKPPPVRTFEKHFAGGLGVMMDDIMAGIYANITVQICSLIIKAL